jgi:branched-chain amino acid transport system substrate-binding protein
VSLLSGEPEYLDPVKEEAPVGWIVTGYPWDKIKTPEYLAFLTAYQKKYNDYPRLGSIVGYSAIDVDGRWHQEGRVSTDSDKLAARLQGLPVDTPFGPSPTARRTISPPWAPMSVRSAVKGGKGVMECLTRMALNSCRPTPKSRPCVPLNKSNEAGIPGMARHAG